MFKLFITQPQTIATGYSPLGQADAVEAPLDVMNDGLKDAFYRYIEGRGESEVVDHCLETMRNVDAARGPVARLTVCQRWISDYVPTWYPMPSLLRFGIGQRSASDRLVERRACRALSQPEPEWQQAWDQAFSNLGESPASRPLQAAAYYMRHKEFSSAALMFSEALATHRQCALAAGGTGAKRDDPVWSDSVVKYTQCLCQLRSQGDEIVTEMLAARQLLKLVKHQIGVPPTIWYHVPYLTGRLLGDGEDVSVQRQSIALAMWDACYDAFDGVAPEKFLTQFETAQKRINASTEHASVVRNGTLVRAKVFENIRPSDAPIVTQAPASVDQPTLDCFEVPEEVQQFMDCVRHGNTMQRAMLLHGPTGTGKTALAEAVLQDLCSQAASDVWVYRLDPNTVLSSGFSESVKNITDIMKSLAKEKNKDGSTRKVIVKIDEVDRLQSRRSADESAENKRITTCLFDAFDNSSSAFDNLYLVATTNLPDDIDSAMRRRYAFQVEVSLPTDETYRKIFSYYARRWDDAAYINIAEVERDNLLWHCQGSSAADLAQALSNGGIKNRHDVLAAVIALSGEKLYRDWKRTGDKTWTSNMESARQMGDVYWALSSESLRLRALAKSPLGASDASLIATADEWETFNHTNTEEISDVLKLLRSNIENGIKKQ